MVLVLLLLTVTTPTLADDDEIFLFVAAAGSGRCSVLLLLFLLIPGFKAFLLRGSLSCGTGKDPVRATSLGLSFPSICWTAVAVLFFVSAAAGASLLETAPAVVVWLPVMSSDGTEESSVYSTTLLRLWEHKLSVIITGMCRKKDTSAAVE